ncbi:cytochrome P450 12a5 mitochondrial [Biomphalaria glabrata]|nr:cytochrome P450 12a5, mitochondrial [Biomphalaria glabrata]
MLTMWKRQHPVLSLCKSVALRHRSTDFQNTTRPADETDIKPFQEIPGPGGIYKWPIIGPLLLFGSSGDGAQKVFDRLFDLYGPIFKVQLFETHVVLSNPKDFETVFRNEGKSPSRPNISIINAFSKRQGLKEPMINLQGEEWYSLRNAANKYLLKADSALHYLSTQNEIADDLVKVLTQQGNMDNDLLFRYTTESISVVVFNKRLGLLASNVSPEMLDIFTATRNVGELIAEAESGKSVMHSYFRNKTYRDFEDSYLKIRKRASQDYYIAKAEVEKREKEGTLQSDERNLLLSLIKEKSLTDDEANNILSSMYIGGADSTSKSLELLLFNLAVNPDKQELLRKEIISLIGSDGPLTASALAQMSYLKACVKESFRVKFPMFAGRNRALPNDCVLSGYKVPAGTNILMMNPRALKLEYADQLAFTPERWLRSNQDRKSDAASNLIISPFGHGPRSCLGQRLAMQEMYIATVKVLQKLNLDLDTESKNTEFAYKLFLEPVKPLRFIVTKLK